jgi:hypothetical protein
LWIGEERRGLSHDFASSRLFYRRRSIEIIAKKTERHFLMGRRNIPIAAFSKSTGCVVNHSQL